MPDIFGGGNDTQETSSQTSYAPWISNGQQSMWAAALAQNLPDILRSSPYSHAGFNPDQQQGFDAVRDMWNMWGPGSGMQSGARGMIGDAMGMASKGGQSQAAMLGPTDYQAFMSPYLDDVLQPATDELQRQTENARAASGAQAAAAGAFGGSRGALRDAQLDRSMQETGSRLVADTMAQGFDKAQALAEGNTNRQQQTNLSNASNSLAAANIGMTGAGLLEQILGGEFNRGRTATGDLLDIGQFQQGDMQSQLDAPYEALARLFGFIPQVYDVTQVGTQPDNSPSFLQQILGAGLTIGGMPVAGGGSLGGNWLDDIFGSALM